MNSSDRSPEASAEADISAPGVSLRSETPPSRSPRREKEPPPTGLRPLAQALRAPIVRHSGSRPPVLSRAAEESMFRTAEVLTEGSLEGGAYSGTTMLTVPFNKLRGLWRNVPATEQARRDLEAVLAGSVRLRLRATRIAREEVLRRFPGVAFETATTVSQVLVRPEGVFIDVEVEVAVAKAPDVALQH